jgi:hypothetical protein
MNTPQSSSPNLPLPRWAYVPGERRRVGFAVAGENGQTELTKTDWVAFSATG